MTTMKGSTMSDQITQAATAAQAVALWWAEQLGAPTFKATGEHDSTEDRVRMDTAAMLAHLAVGPAGLTAEQAQKFVDVLTKTVEARLERGPSYGVHLGVDYGPDPDLYEAADQAGIPTKRFPWKTRTNATQDYVTAALGYGEPHRLVWTRPGWERPVCGTRRYTPDWTTPLPEVCGLLRFHDERDHGQWIPKEVSTDD